MSPRIKKVVSGLAVVAVVAPAMIWWENHKKSEVNAEVKAEAIASLERLADEDAPRAYYRSLVEQHHTVAFDGAYTRGGRRRSARFDETKYYDQLLALMAEQAQQDGKAAEAAALQTARISMLAASVESGEAP